MVCSKKFHRSQLLQAGLEIPIKLRLGKGKASLEIFRKIKDFVLDNDLQPEKISPENNHIRIFKCNRISI